MLVDEDLLPGITWLELVVMPTVSLDQVNITIRPVTGMLQPCFGVRVARKGWLRSNNGEQAVFRSFEAAVHLLHLLGVAWYAHGEGLPLEQRDASIRCYRLHDNTLALCKGCAGNHKNRSISTAASCIAPPIIAN